MKIVFKVARAELRTLFYSPIAWIVIVVFFVITGMQFVSALKELAKMQEVSMQHNPNYEGVKTGLTLNMFLASIEKALSYFYLFIPLLTMGAISREHNSGTIKLLYSSPIRVRELVAGKFFGLMFFNFILLSSIALLLFKGSLTIKEVDSPIYVSVLLGFFLLSNTYMAIGLFISSLTNYQIVAGIITYMVFFFLSIVGKLLQGYDLLRDITYFMSISGRVDYMVAGLITSRNVIYYLLLIILFLAFTIIKLRSTQESKKWTTSFARYLLAAVSVLFLGYLSSRPGKVAYCDVTRDNINTIDSTTQEVFKELDGSPLTVTLYTNLLDPRAASGLPTERNNYLWNYWEKFLRFYPNIQFKYEYYYKLDDSNEKMKATYPGKTDQEMAALQAKVLGVNLKGFKKPDEIEQIIDLSNEPAFLLMELEYKGAKTLLRTYFSKPIWPWQSNVSAALRQLVRDSMPHVVFTTGHFERNTWKLGERDYTGHTNYKGRQEALINNGVRIDSISLTAQHIASHTDVLVVADPKTLFEPVEQARITEYLANGGNAFFYAEPGKQQVLNPILNRIGVNLEDGIIINQGSSVSPLEVMSKLTPTGQAMAREESMQLYQLNNKLGAAGLFLGACELTYQELEGFNIEPIAVLKGRGNIWVEKGYQGVDSARATYSPAEGDMKKDGYVLGIKMTRTINNKEQRIVVMGDADFMSSKHHHGFSIGVGLYSWLLYNEYPLYIKYNLPKDVFLSIGQNTGNAIWNTYVYIIPGIILLVGLLVIIRRSRK